MDTAEITSYFAKGGIVNIKLKYSYFLMNVLVLKKQFRFFIQCFAWHALLKKDYLESQSSWKKFFWLPKWEPSLC